MIMDASNGDYIIATSRRTTISQSGLSITQDGLSYHLLRCDEVPGPTEVITFNYHCSNQFDLEYIYDVDLRSNENPNKIYIFYYYPTVTLIQRNLNLCVSRSIGHWITLIQLTRIQNVTHD